MAKMAAFLNIIATSSQTSFEAFLLSYCHHCFLSALSSLPDIGWVLKTRSERAGDLSSEFLLDQRKSPPAMSTLNDRNRANQTKLTSAFVGALRSCPSPGHVPMVLEASLAIGAVCSMLAEADHVGLSVLIVRTALDTVSCMSIALTSKI